MGNLVLALYLIGYAIALPKMYRFIVKWDASEVGGSVTPAVLLMVIALIFTLLWPVLALAMVLTRVVRKEKAPQ